MHVKAGDFVVVPVGVGHMVCGYYFAPSFFIL